MKKLKYVSFYNVLTDSMFDGFLVREDHEYFHTIDPLCYEWLLKKEKMEWIDLLETRQFEKEYFSYHEVKLPNSWSFARNYEWLFDFPVKKDEIHLIPTLSLYFEWMVKTQTLPLYERFEKAEKAINYNLPSRMLKRIRTYMVDYFKDDPERLRILFGKKH